MNTFILQWLSANGYRINIYGQWYGPKGKVTHADIIKHYNETNKQRPDLLHAAK